MSENTNTDGNSNMNSVITNKYDYSIYFYVKDGNPNGDPDSDNRPRIDEQTRHGLVTAECIRRKVRNYIEMSKQGMDGFDIFVRSGAILNNITEDVSKDVKSKKLQDVRPVLCQKFYDVRAFGGVLSTGLFSGDPDGQLRGPVQLGMARSIDPIDIQQITVTRCCVTDKEDKDKNRTMGGRYLTPFGLYRANGAISVPYAEKTKFSIQDLNVYFESLLNMFENDKSAGRPEMGVVKLVIFKHQFKLGNVHSYKLYNSVVCKKNESVVYPRSVSDYTITVDASIKQQLEGKVEIIEM